MTKGLVQFLEGTSNFLFSYHGPLGHTQPHFQFAMGRVAGVEELEAGCSCMYAAVKNVWNFYLHSRICVHGMILNGHRHFNFYGTMLSKACFI